MKAADDAVSDAVRSLLVAVLLFHYHVCRKLINWAFLFLGCGHTVLDTSTPGQTIRLTPSWMKGPLSSESSEELWKEPLSDG